MHVPTILLTLLQTPMTSAPDTLVLADFALKQERAWFAVNDGVMGGVSSSQMDVTSDGLGVFAGDLSLENNGGFASVRSDIRAYDLSPFSGLVLRVRGDGRRYQVRLRTGSRYRGLAYKAEFDTKADTWITIEVPFAEFVPTVRGYVPRGAPPLDLTSVQELGLLLGDGRPGPFRLEVERIMAVGDPLRGR